MPQVSTTTLAEWTGRGTTVGAVLGQLDALRRQGQRLGSRTSVVTLVVRAPSAVDAWDAVSTVHRFGGHHPARSIVLVTGDGSARVDARVALTEAEAAGHRVWFEDVLLSVSGPASQRLGRLVEPFALSDLPVAVWYLGTAPQAGDDLLTVADAVLVDSKLAVGDEGGDAAPDGAAGALPDLATLGGITELFGRVPVVDLAWIRLRPWRELLATLVEGDTGQLLQDLTKVEVAGKAGARALLGGWLASRLRLRPGSLTLTDARHASIRLEGRCAGGQPGWVAVERVTGERLVRASASIEGGASHSDLLALPAADLSWSLGQALGALQRDRTYEAAVRAAAALDET